MGLFDLLQGRVHHRPEMITPRQALDEIARREHVHFSALVLGYGIRKALPHFVTGGTGRDIVRLLGGEAFTVRVRPNSDVLTYPGLEAFEGNLSIARLRIGDTLNFYIDAAEVHRGKIINYGYTVIDYGEKRPCCCE